MSTEYTDSSLATYTHLVKGMTPNRTHPIDTITPHIVVGQCGLSALGATFDARNVSANYGIGTNGDIGLFVHEKDRSWCSSNADNDNRAITIEIASDTIEPYAVNEKAWASLVKLCVDICKRNGIKELKWRADPKLIGDASKQNITVHRWFANKSCPGTYVFNRLGELASEVNAILSTGAQAKSYPVLYKVQTGAFQNKTAANTFASKLRGKGYNPYVCKVTATLFRVQVGAFSTASKATKLRKQLAEDGFEAFVTTLNRAKALPEAKKANKTIAKEVIAGLWGYGEDRKKRLTMAGYNYSAIQKEVNKLI